MRAQVPPGFCDSVIAKSSKLRNFRKSSQIWVIAANFGFRHVPWRHRNALSVKERLFLSLKNGMNSLAFSSCPIYKSYIGQTPLDKVERIRATRLGYAEQYVYLFGTEPQSRYRYSPETCKWEELVPITTSRRSLRTSSGRSLCR